MKLTNLAKTAFFIALIAILFLALKPATGHFRTHFPIDKINHFIAFFVLMALSIAAFPKIKISILFIFLALLGIIIELLQATPFINRDMELGDFIAELIAMFAVLGVYFAAIIRTNK